MGGSLPYFLLSASFPFLSLPNPIFPSFFFSSLKPLSISFSSLPPPSQPSFFPPVFPQLLCLPLSTYCHALSYSSPIPVTLSAPISSWSFLPYPNLSLSPSAPNTIIFTVCFCPSASVILYFCPPSPAPSLSFCIPTSALSLSSPTLTELSLPSLLLITHPQLLWAFQPIFIPLPCRFFQSSSRPTFPSPLLLLVAHPGTAPAGLLRFPQTALSGSPAPGKLSDLHSPHLLACLKLLSVAHQGLQKLVWHSSRELSKHAQVTLFILQGI